MEPASERREHTVTLPVEKIEPDDLQWSPPVSGGNTIAAGTYQAKVTYVP
jgi:hypothetical protein